MNDEKIEGETQDVNGSGSSACYLDNRVRRAVVNRCGGCCEDCGEKCRLTMHHRHYDTVGKESADDIAGLCWGCHKARHRDMNGEYWRNEQDKETHWFTFWEEWERD